MHFGFSYVGLIYLVMLIVPNILWTKNRPQEYERYARNESRALAALERIGEVLVSCIALIFSDFNLRLWTAWCWWLALSFLLMLLYEFFWLRYFKSEKRMQDFYSSLGIFPVAGATLPVAAFFLLGIYGSNILMILSTVILGIGHIGIHRAHAKESGWEKKKSRLLIRILKGIGLGLLAIVFAAISLVIGARNIRSIGHYKNLVHGVDEAVYLPIDGQEQYVLLLGQDVFNPVIVYLHGGPSSPDAYCAYTFSDRLTDAYTFVCWDQRGCGRTYFRNIGADPNNQTATFEQAKKDLDILVDYARNRFGQEQVIIMGHSYGTILGSQYALEHPEKVSAYIGAAQVTSLEQTDMYSYQDALEKAKAAGDSTKDLEAAFEAYRQNGDLVSLMALRKVVSPYHPAAIESSETWDAITSPYFGVDDFRWFLKQIGDANAYFALNRQLFDVTLAFDVYGRSMAYNMPVYFISGSEDWICPVDTVQTYLEALSAPRKEMILMDGCGHNTQYALPKQFAEIVKELQK